MKRALWPTPASSGQGHTCRRRVRCAQVPLRLDRRTASPDDDRSRAPGRCPGPLTARLAISDESLAVREADELGVVPCGRQSEGWLGHQRAQATSLRIQGPRRSVQRRGTEDCGEELADRLVNGLRSGGSFKLRPDDGRHEGNASTRMRAVAIAREIALLVTQTGSARMRAELATMQRSILPWKASRVGRHLRKCWRHRNGVGGNGGAKG